MREGETGNRQNSDVWAKAKEGNVTTNIDKIVEIAEEFHIYLCSSRHNLDENGKGRGPEEFDIPLVATAEVKNASQAMRRTKVAGGAK